MVPSFACQLTFGPSELVCSCSYGTELSWTYLGCQLSLQSQADDPLHQEEVGSFCPLPVALIFTTLSHEPETLCQRSGGGFSEGGHGESPAELLVRKTS